MDELELSGLIEAAEEHSVVIGAGVGGVVTGAWALKKVLGPSLDVIGAALGRFTERRIENLASLGQRLAARLGDETDRLLELPELHPRVVKVILDEASWIDDHVTQEYFAGMLLGSPEDVMEQQEVVYFAELASRLSPNQVRLHFALYDAFTSRDLRSKEELKDDLFEKFSFGNVGNCRALAIFTPTWVSPSALPVLPMKLSEAANVLMKQSLIDDLWILPSARPPDPKWIPRNMQGLHAAPNMYGAQLFSLALGLGVDGYRDLDALRTTPRPPDMPAFAKFWNPDGLTETGRTNQWPPGAGTVGAARKREQRARRMRPPHDSE